MPRPDIQALYTAQERTSSLLPPTIESATVVAPSTFLTRISGTVQIATITPPTDGAHLLCFIFTDAVPGALLTTGNIANSITPTTNTAIFLMYDPVTNKYYANSPGTAASSGLPLASFLASGGQIVWVDDYNFVVTAATYIINDVQYSSPQTDITLDPAHATLDRIDVIAVTTSGTVVKVTGTAAAQPSEPDIDPGTQLKLGIILVTAASTEPAGATSELIYADNTGGPSEWNWVVSGSGFDVNSTAEPIPPSTKNIEGTNVAAGAYCQGTRPTGTINGGNQNLNLYIKPVSNWGNGRGLQISFRNNDVLVGLSVAIQRTGTFGFVHTNPVYQLVSIPLSAFGLNKFSTADDLRITGFGGAINVRIDNITITDGAVTPNTPTGITQEFADARYRQISEAVEVNVGNSGTSLAIDLASGLARSYFITLTGNVTITLTNPALGGRYLFVFKQDGVGGRTVTWSPVPLWSEGAAPVITATAAAVSLVTLAYSAVNSGKYLGAANLNNS